MIIFVCTIWFHYPNALDSSLRYIKLILSTQWVPVVVMSATWVCCSTSKRKRRSWYSRDTHRSIWDARKQDILIWWYPCRASYITHVRWLHFRGWFHSRRVVLQSQIVLRDRQHMTESLNLGRYLSFGIKGRIATKYEFLPNTSIADLPKRVTLSSGAGFWICWSSLM